MKAMPFLLKTLKLQAIKVKKILRKELLVSMFVSAFFHKIPEQYQNKIKANNVKYFFYGQTPATRYRFSYYCMNFDYCNKRKIMKKSFLK